MSETKRIIAPDSDENVILAIDQLLYQDKLGVVATEDGWYVVEFSSFTRNVWETLSKCHNTRGDAYQDALNTLIDCCIFASTRDDES